MAVFQETAVGVKALGDIKTGVTTKNVMVDPKTQTAWTTYTDRKKSYAKSWVLL